MSVTPDGIKYAETMADGKYKMQGLMDPRQGKAVFFYRLLHYHALNISYLN